MSRYIDADKLLTDELTHVLPFGCGKSSGRVVVFISDIEKQPTADVEEVRHGEWRENLHIGYCGYNGSSYECSNCHKEVYDLDDMNYCSKCGAKMDGERKEE